MSQAPEWVKGGVQAKEGALQSLRCCTQTWGVRLIRCKGTLGGWVEVHQEVWGPQAGPLSAQACRRLACKNDGVWREGAGSSHPALRWNRSKGALRGWAGSGCGAHGPSGRDGACGSSEEPAEQGAVIQQRGNV